MEWYSFALGASLVAVIVAIHKAIKSDRQRRAKLDVIRRKHSHEHIEIHNAIKLLQDEMVIVFQNLEKLENKKR